MAIKLIREIREGEGRPFGATCSDPGECMSGHCVDGHCAASHTPKHCSPEDEEKIADSSVKLRTRLNTYINYIDRCFIGNCEQARGTANQMRAEFEALVRSCCDGDDFIDHIQHNCFQDAWDDVVDRFTDRISNQCELVPPLQPICESVYSRVSELYARIPECPSESLCDTLYEEAYWAETEIEATIKAELTKHDCSQFPSLVMLPDIAICDVYGYRVLDLLNSIKGTDDYPANARIPYDPFSLLEIRCDRDHAFNTCDPPIDT